MAWSWSVNKNNIFGGSPHFSHVQMTRTILNDLVKILIHSSTYISLSDLVHLEFLQSRITSKINQVSVSFLINETLEIQTHLRNLCTTLCLWGRTTRMLGTIGSLSLTSTTTTTLEVGISLLCCASSLWLWVLSNSVSRCLFTLYIYNFTIPLNFFIPLFYTLIINYYFSSDSLCTCWLYIVYTVWLFFSNTSWYDSRS